VILVDTDVLVDVVRRYPPAVQWLEQLGSTDLSIPGFVVMELIEGCRSGVHQRQVERMLEPFKIVWPSELACERALKVFAENYLAHGLGILDAVIGQTAVELDVPLASFNQKHYTAIAGLQTLQPYTRTA
jgi:predicted nucleic acid-binding protein